MKLPDELLARLDKRVANNGTEHPEAAARIRAQAARIAELEALLLEADEIFEDSQSGYIPGCDFDQKWTARRNELMASIEALRAADHEV